MASCTAVSVRDRGRFCLSVVRDRLERFGRGRIRRDARMMTCLSENFFSSSRVRLRRAWVRVCFFHWSMSWKEREPVLDDDSALPLLDPMEALQ